MSSVQVRPDRYTSTGTLPFEALAGMKILKRASVPPSTSDYVTTVPRGHVS